jgi:hypothetical protein
MSAESGMSRSVAATLRHSARTLPHPSPSALSEERHSKRHSMRDVQGDVRGHMHGYVHGHVQGDV